MQIEIGIIIYEFKSYELYDNESKNGFCVLNRFTVLAYQSKKNDDIGMLKTIP